MSAATVIRRCASSEEAAVVCALLNNAGIPAQIDNWHHASLNWLIVPALGGVGVLVPATQAEDAKHLIEAAVASAEQQLTAEFPDLDNDVPRRNRLHALTFAGFYSGWSYYLLATVLALIYALIDMAASAPAGAVSWQHVADHLSRVFWLDGLFYAATSLAGFLVLLGIFVFLTRRFLNQRARQTPPA